MNVRVGGDTRLSYRVFPSMADGDRDYDATNVAVDLVFTDGTRLSALGALDQHGFPLTPRGQGASKALYVNQWNNVSARIGSVAAEQDRRPDPGGVRLPDGPAKFRGWLDDVTLKPVAPERRRHTCRTTR
ncbi:hypothetical protein LT493_30400 [Streptomyces tricolor]|nr:hypothetical protein [Streptomyces tricolor]